MFHKVELWVVGCLALFFFIISVAFGAIVLDEERGAAHFGAIGKAALLVAEVPDTLKSLSKADKQMEAFSSKRFPDKSGWQFSQDAFTSGLTGYLLVSRYDGDQRRHVVELVSLKDGAILHRWAPDAGKLLAGLPHDSSIAEYTSWNMKSYRVIHPVLLPNGDMIVKDHQSPLFRVDACSNKVWSQTDRLFHHSTEPDGTGGYWIPAYLEPSVVKGAGPDFADESLAHVSEDGKILWEKSLAEIFIENGLMPAVFTAGAYVDNPLHLNDIQPVLTDGPYWKAGDLFLSLRHKSEIVLYRPSTNKIIWQKQGPWMAQHDVDVLDDHRISVFDNNAYDKGRGGYVDGQSEVLVYDFATDTVTSPFHDAMVENQVVTLFEGLVDFLPSGAVFIEEENAGRLLVLGPDGRKMIEYVNRAKNGHLYRLGWSRYVSQELGDAAVAAMAQKACDGA